MATVVYAADVGSVRCKAGRGSKFAWVRVDPARPIPHGSSDIGQLADQVIRDLQGRKSVALGFEALLFIPVPVESFDLCRGRKNEGSRAFAAPVGLAVTTLGLHEAAWILRRVAAACGNLVKFETNVGSWPPPRNAVILFCWEAFVSGRAHSHEHIRDAATAAMAFLAAENNLVAATTIAAECPLSLIAAAALWSGLVTDVATLRQSTVVIRPEDPFTAEIHQIKNKGNRCRT